MSLLSSRCSLRSFEWIGDAVASLTSTTVLTKQVPSLRSIQLTSFGGATEQFYFLRGISSPSEGSASEKATSMSVSQLVLCGQSKHSIALIKRLLKRCIVATGRLDSKELPATENLGTKSQIEFFNFFQL